MKKITCVGYHGTGSGVIDDLFREFDNVTQGYYEAECRILHDADGISDLEYHLIDNPHRLKTSVAINRFISYAKENKRMCEKIFGEAWLPLCYEFVDSIVDFKYKGYLNKSLFTEKPHLKYVLFLYKIINKIRPLKYRHIPCYNYFPDATTYHAAPDRNVFLNSVNRFVDKLCDAMPHSDTTEYYMIDQLLPVDNILHYLRYVPDLKVIVVDRDPRDLYINHHSHNDHVLPKDPYQFCKYYRDIRRNKSDEDVQNALYVTFEDMIYKYDEMVKTITNYVGISIKHHVKPQTHFIPEISIKGTQLWKTTSKYSQAIRIIEKELPEFLHIY